MKYKNFEELPIWQSAREIVNLVYSVIDKNEKLGKDFRLSGQLIGSAISVMNNACLVK